MRPIWGKPAVEINVEGKRWILIADLHIGYEMELTNRGVYVPDQSSRMLERILSLGRASGLFIAGDLKHSISLFPSSRIKGFLAKLSQHFERVEVVQGNHDGGLQNLVGRGFIVHGTRGVPLDDVWIFHGHAYPHEESSSYDFGIMGHVHPSISLRGIGRVPVWVVGDSSCDNLPRTIILVPAFNELVGYGDILNPSDSGPVFPKCFDPDSTDVLTLEGEYIGTLSFLISRGKLIY
ncbi:MAG: metallophosphoesterase [Candidatus Korarchaeum sp.]|nr:metallophosphoesterase [Candidatus Korarchaeum sp.]